MALLFLCGCATSSNTGVRADYHKQPVERVAVVPFYAKASFGLDESQLDSVLDSSQKAAVETLRAEGFEVVEPEVFRDHLAQHEAESKFDDGVLLRSSLSNYFEPSDSEDERASLEVATVTELYEEDKLPGDALFFGELVYHTRAECRSDPSQYNERAEVSYHTEQARRADSSPCLVSHIRVKLVDAESGETMWVNNKLLQTHAAREGATSGPEHAAEAVTRTLGGDQGLQGLVGGADAAKAGEYED